jgi:hypothetical protein
MSHKLALEVPNEVYGSLADTAKRTGATPEELAVKWLAAAAVPGAAAKEPVPIEAHFRELVRQWKEATRFVSSTHVMVSHPAYLAIIGMGKEALPLLLDELRREPDHWFIALEAITGTNPIPPSVRGNVEEMTHAWLAWAEQHGL